LTGREVVAFNTKIVRCSVRFKSVYNRALVWQVSRSGRVGFVFVFYFVSLLNFIYFLF